MINYDLTIIKAIIFDVDGVLSKDTIVLDKSAEPLRSINTKDGYAIQFACKNDLIIGIITGADTEAVRKRYLNLGVKDIYMASKVKMNDYQKILKQYDLKPEQVIYVGDDIPDYQVLKSCGCPCCPADAVSDIKQICTYISHIKGGEGCARDIIEQVLRAQNKWLQESKAYGW